jgi:predicted Zn-dependent peptidase
VNSSHIAIGGVLEAGNLSEALNLYSDIILQPRLEDEQFEPARHLAIDDVLSLDDDPKQKVILKLRESFYPSPLGRSTEGDIEQLKKLKPKVARQTFKNYLNPSQIVFSVAGKYDFEAVASQMEKLFGHLKPGKKAGIEIGGRGNIYTHIHDDSAQVHIGLMTGTAKPGDDDYYDARTAISVLSGGMSSRLFTEIREKRGLCYAIGARYHGLKEAAGIMCYAGTTPDKAQETVEMIIAEFNRLKDGISDEEVKRAKAGLKSALILQSESSSSRSSAIASDYYILGRVRSLDEIKEGIEKTTVDSVVNYLKENNFENFFVVTIGPKELIVK